MCAGSASSCTPPPQLAQAAVQGCMWHQAQPHIPALCPVPLARGCKARASISDPLSEVSRRRRIHPSPTGRTEGRWEWDGSISAPVGLSPGCCSPDQAQAPALASALQGASGTRSYPGSALKRMGGSRGLRTPLLPRSAPVSRRCRARAIPGGAEHGRAQDGEPQAGHGAAEQQHGCVRAHPR